MLGWAPSMKAIRDFVKIRLRYSYKRGVTRVLTCKKKELPYIQSIFCSRILQNFQSGIILINLDESTFTRSVKWDYSWFPKSKSHPIFNSSWIGRESMISTMLSNGEWIWTLKSGTIKSEDFIKFLLILEIYICKSLIIDKESSLITLDNSPVHISKISKLAAKHLILNLSFLPPYSLTLALVELIFGVLKRRIAVEHRDKVINFGQSSGTNAIVNAMQVINKTFVLKLWSRFRQEAVECLINVKIKQQISSVLSGWVDEVANYE